MTLRQVVQRNLPQMLDFAPTEQAQLALLDRKAVDAGIVHLEVARGVQRQAQRGAVGALEHAACATSASVCPG
jgi:hypothetical protein